jgi:hypothetical protein
MRKSNFSSKLSVRDKQSGCLFWTKSVPFSNKILMLTFNASPAYGWAGKIRFADPGQLRKGVS